MREGELTAYFSYLVRHLSKHEVLEEAGFFIDEPYEGGWNNDTVVFALQTILRAAGWPVEPYVDIGRGLCPPNEFILQELGMIPPDRKAGSDG